MHSRRFSTRFIWSLIFVSELRRRQFMKKRKIAVRVVATPAHLDGLIEEATVDCHDDNEQASGFFNMVEDTSCCRRPRMRRRGTRLNER